VACKRPEGVEPSEGALPRAVGQGISTRPASSTFAPYWTWTGTPGVSLTPLTKVPLVERKSSTTKPPPARVSRQCAPDTTVSDTRRSQPGALPTNHESRAFDSLSSITPDSGGEHTLSRSKGRRMGTFSGPVLGTPGICLRRSVSSPLCVVARGWVLCLLPNINDSFWPHHNSGERSRMPLQGPCGRCGRNGSARCELGESEHGAWRPL